MCMYVDDVLIVGSKDAINQCVRHVKKCSSQIYQNLNGFSINYHDRLLQVIFPDWASLGEIIRPVTNNDVIKTLVCINFC